MTKQEEIRGEVARFCCGVCEPADRGCEEADGHCEEATGVADKILSYLHSQGVVIKVERELPENPWLGDEDFHDRIGSIEERKIFWQVYELAQQTMLKAGFVAVEPLIKEE